MKTLTLIILIIIITVPAFAQPHYLISGKIENSGFGGPVIKTNTFNNELGVMVGGRGGWIINHRLIIGGGGYGLVTELDYEYIIPDSILNMTIGYGGFEMEYIFNPDNLVNYSVYAMIGGGEVRLSLDELNTTTQGNSDKFFAFEPACYVTVNVTEWLRISAGASYLITSGIDELGLTDDDIGGLSGSLTFRFGKF